MMGDVVYLVWVVRVAGDGESLLVDMRLVEEAVVVLMRMMLD
jgi:hypothetical protein